MARFRVPAPALRNASADGKSRLRRPVAGIHLPLYVTVLGRFAVLIPMFLGLSVIMAWIYLRTGQGVLLMLLFHASLDTVQFVLPLGKAAHGDQTFVAIMLTIVAMAALVLWRTGPDLGQPRIKE
jgi:hypothetical protein